MQIGQCSDAAQPVVNFALMFLRVPVHFTREEEPITNHTHRPHVLGRAPPERIPRFQRDVVGPSWHRIVRKLYFHLWQLRMLQALVVRPPEERQALTWL